MAFGKKNEERPEQTAPDASPADAEDDLSDAFPDGDATSEPATADPLAGGDLLNMFQTTTIEEADRSVLLELAGEVDLGDLLEELHTISAAIAVTRSGGCEVVQDTADERRDRHFAREPRVRRISA